MANILEEKLREASCIGDLEAVKTLLSQNINVNSQNPVNGWTALHWACKRGNERVVRLLLTNGADKNVKNFKEETPSDICTYSNIIDILGIETVKFDTQGQHNSFNFVPSYIKNAPLNAQVDVDSIRVNSDIFSMPKTALPAGQSDELVLKVRVHGSPDPDFIEIEIPKWKLTYNTLLKICCEELQISETQVERIRKLPNTRLRKDNDVKRLTDFQALEVIIRNNSNEKANNCYQSISTCKDQTILY
ncbi:ankyrin repeat domain-containing protein 40-like [Rhynchophorus ferrugineus]|uniref:ankyrin repeat domain-containing protein 40-like n=1 Tax=Rhynchophorus ferrugineus TaxID=354439 RepID=UPI003FCEC2CC